MVELTDAARSELDGYFADKEKSPIRIYLTSGGCSGPRLALALDEAGEADATFPCDGYEFIVDKALAEEAGKMTVDMTYMGFQIASGLNLPQGGCSCGSSGCGSDSGSCCC